MPRILIIDDDDQFRGMLQTTLEKAGFEVDAAENGKVGYRMLVEHSVDLIITDLIMPEKDGVETIMDVRREFPGLKVIAISGGGRVGPDSYLNMVKQMGVSGTFSKPLDMPGFLGAVRDTLAIESESA